jgi:hypothetical protein
VNDVNHSAPKKAFKIPAGSVWDNAWKMSAVVAAIGIAASAAGWVLQAERFAFSYLYGFVTVMTIWIGSVFFCLIQHLTAAGWSVSVRRASEFFVSGAPVLIVLFIPLIFHLHTLYPWWNVGGSEEHGVAHAQERMPEHPAELPATERAMGRPSFEHATASEGNGEHAGPHEVLEEENMKKKGAFLNHTFFGIRMAVYFAIWLWLAARLFGYSVAQDAAGDKQYTVKLQRFSPPATFLFALSLTFAGFDLVMSLEPGWYSTMFGVRVFASSAVTSFACVILVTLGWKRAGLIGNEINTEHWHDLGKLMFGFLIFWGYVSFSEFMLIWYAAIPEETIYYHRRWDDNSWRMLSCAVVVLKFIVPFYITLSRNAKRNNGIIGFGAFWLLAMHLVEMYYWIMPYYHPLEPIQWGGMWMEIGAVMATVGVFLTYVFRKMRNHSLIAVGDPRLPRALNFIQV